MGLTSLQGNYALNQLKSTCRPLIHIFGESEVTSLPYSYNRYIFDVYINNVLILREFKAITFDTTIYAYLDVAPIIENYIKANIQPMYLPYIQYQVKYGVEDLSGNLTTNLYTDTSYAWYGYPSFRNDDLRADLGGAYTDRMYLSTNRSRKIQIWGNYSVYIPIYKSTIYSGALADYWYQGSMNAIMDSAGTGVYNHQLFETMFDWNLPASNQYFYYDVEGDAIDNMPSSQVYFEYPCTKNNPVMIHFLNSLGGFESFLFSGVNRVNTNIERQSINKLGLITTLTSSGISRDVDINRQHNRYIGETKVNYSNTMAHKMRLVSDYISETDFLWLRELLASPQVYAQIDNSVLMIPVTIETSDWAEKKRGADKIFNLEIDILLGTQTTQLR